MAYASQSGRARLTLPPWVKPHKDSGVLPSVEELATIKSQWLSDNPDDRAVWDEFDRQFEADLLRALQS